MNRRRLLSGLLLIAVTMKAAAKGKSSVNSSRVDFPGHSLESSLPIEMTHTLDAMSLPTFFDPADPDAFVKGARGLATGAFEFAGPFWSDSLGSVAAYVSVIERNAAYRGDIATPSGLAEYIRWWFPLVTKKSICDFGLTTVNGVPAVSRRFGNWDETISFPLAPNAFLEFTLKITRVSGKATGSWARRAEAMRDQIRASIFFKTTTSTSKAQGDARLDASRILRSGRPGRFFQTAVAHWQRPHSSLPAHFGLTL